jgi:hypothetical protein
VEDVRIGGYYRRVAFHPWVWVLGELKGRKILTLCRRIVGYGYHKYYKHLVLEKIDKAFNQGDPALNLARAGRNGPWYNSEPLNNSDDGGGGEAEGVGDGDGDLYSFALCCPKTCPKTCPILLPITCAIPSMYYSMRRILGGVFFRRKRLLCSVLSSPFLRLTEMIADDSSCVGSHWSNRIN